LTECFLSFLLAAMAAFCLTFAVRRLAHRCGALDRPQQRKVHLQPIPTWGGLGLFGGIVVAALVFCLVDKGLVGILLGSALLVLTGLVDDRFDMRAVQKLVCQIGAALVLLGFGVGIRGFTHPLTGDYLSLAAWQTWLATILWVVCITNTLNLIDGLDGLAAGVSCLSAGTLSVLALQQGYGEVAILAAAVSGGCLGFLRHNFNPARIFMGDTGSQMLGFLLAAIAVAGTVKKPAVIAILVPVLILGVPVTDTLLAVIRRSWRRESIFSADREHLHHRLLDRGLSQKQVVLVLYGVTAVLCMLALAVSHYA